MREELSRKQFFLTPTHQCSYLVERNARTLFLDPRETVDKTAYTTLTQAGFRRSGAHLYRPHCEGCNACVPVRVPIRDFTASRRFRRIAKRNEDLAVGIEPATYTEECYRLYSDYIVGRHGDGDMYPPTPEQFRSFLLSAWSDTCFVTLRDGTGAAVAVAVTDQLDDGLSAIYTFFDPRQPGRSLGVYSVLTQIEQCRLHNRPYLYLGYWVKDCAKMSYKVEYRPIELYIDGRWITMH